ncbi:hypothetical protein [Lacticaseibacillus suibinensis]|uniref:hypothetical protein n=1 Tax=Lacticaseibacillus suibinensis TaxID=2486011 RepID=UPI000F76F99C|nr:hypothetical protein [Lacticaseibacillus suibinensis]
MKTEKKKINQADSLLDQDIEGRFAKEKKEIVKPTKKKPGGKGSQIFMAFLLAGLMLIGILVPLLTMF